MLKRVAGFVLVVAMLPIVLPLAVSLALMVYPFIALGGLLVGLSWMLPKED